MEEPKETNRRRPFARTAEVLLFWLPVFVPLILLAQLGTKGLRPALAESKRLEQKERELNEKQTLALERQRDLAAGIEALGDPIYRERIMRRRRHDAELAIEASFESAETPTRRR